MGAQRTKHRKTKVIVVGCAALAAFGLVATQPMVFRYRLWQARQAIVNRHPVLAIARLQTLQKSYGNNAEISFLLARANRHRDAYGQVLDALQEAHRLGYPVDQLERERLLTMAESGQMALDDPQLQDLVANPANDAREIYEALVKGYYRLYEFGPASLVLEVWQESFPHDAQPLLYRGLLKKHEEKWAEAELCFRQALALAPERPDLRRHLAQTEQAQYHYRQAIYHFRGASQQREEVESLVGLGQCLKARGELESARAAFSQGLELSRNDFDCLLALGELDLDAGKGAAALLWLEPAAQLKPKDYDARYALAKALLFSGRGLEARPHFRFAAAARQELSRVKALRQQVVLQPENAEIRYQIGKALTTYGDPQEAFKWLNSVLQYAPDHRPAHEMLADLYAEQGNEAAAERHRSLATPEK